MSNDTSNQQTIVQSLHELTPAMPAMAKMSTVQTLDSLNFVKEENSDKIDSAKLTGAMRFHDEKLESKFAKTWMIRYKLSDDTSMIFSMAFIMVLIMVDTSLIESTFQSFLTILTMATLMFCVILSVAKINLLSVFGFMINKCKCQYNGNSSDSRSGVMIKSNYFGMEIYYCICSFMLLLYFVIQDTLFNMYYVTFLLYYLCLLHFINSFIHLRYHSTRFIVLSSIIIWNILLIINSWFKLELNNNNQENESKKVGFIEEFIIGNMVLSYHKAVIIRNCFKKELKSRMLFRQSIISLHSALRSRPSISQRDSIASINIRRDSRYHDQPPPPPSKVTSTNTTNTTNTKIALSKEGDWKKHAQVLLQTQSQSPASGQQQKFPPIASLDNFLEDAETVSKRNSKLENSRSDGSNGIRNINTLEVDESTSRSSASPTDHDNQNTPPTSSPKLNELVSSREHFVDKNNNNKKKKNINQRQKKKTGNINTNGSVGATHDRFTMSFDASENNYNNKNINININMNDDDSYNEKYQLGLDEIDTIHLKWIQYLGRMVQTREKQTKLSSHANYAEKGQSESKKQETDWNESKNNKSTQVDDLQNDVDVVDVVLHQSSSDYLSDKPHLVQINEVPGWYGVYPFITAGYRVNHSILDATKSMFRWHNELLNIWTEFIPGFILIAMDIYYVINYDFWWRTASFTTKIIVISTFYIGIRPFISGIVHTYYVVNIRVYTSMWKLDYISFTAIIATGALDFTYLTFYCDSITVRVTLLIGWTCFFICIAFAVTYPDLSNSIIEISMAVCGIIGKYSLLSIMFVYKYGTDDKNYDLPQNVWINWLIGESLCLFAFIVKGAQIPEICLNYKQATMLNGMNSNSPNSHSNDTDGSDNDYVNAENKPSQLLQFKDSIWNYVLTSHQLWHICTNVGAMYLLMGGFHFVKYRTETAECL